MKFDLEKDLKLCEKTTEINRQFFEEALAVHDGVELARRLREGIDIPIGGFSDWRTFIRWYNRPGMSESEKDARHEKIRAAVAIMLRQLRLKENYANAVWHFLKSNEIGRIPGNFEIVLNYDRGVPRSISTNEHIPLNTGEATFVTKLKKALHERLANGPKRTRSNAERDEEILQLSKAKERGELDYVTDGVRTVKLTDVDLAGRIDDPVDGNPCISKEADALRAVVFRKAKKRAEGRH